MQFFMEPKSSLLSFDLLNDVSFNAITDRCYYRYHLNYKIKITSELFLEFMVNHCLKISKKVLFGVFISSKLWKYFSNFLGIMF